MRRSFGSGPALLMLLTGTILPVQAQTEGKPAPPAPKTDSRDTKPEASAKNPAAPGKPARDRWPVKTASDLDAADINPVPEKTTIEALLKLPRPVDLPLKGSNPTMQERRARPVETTTYLVEADVIQCQLMPDGDYRVVLRGVSGKTLVMEMPNPAPDFVPPSSPFAAQIKAARTRFESKYQPTSKLTPLMGHAHITGVGYFGRAYGDKVPEGNLIQLHPVLKVEWLPKATAAFATPKTSGTPPVPKAKDGYKDKKQGKSGTTKAHTAKGRGNPVEAQR